MFLPVRKNQKTHLILMNTKSQNLVEASSSIKYGLSLALNSTDAKLTIHVLIIADQA